MLLPESGQPFHKLPEQDRIIGLEATAKSKR